MRRKMVLEWIPAIVGVMILYGAMFSLGITCPIKFLTGISCAGCGMTRAWLALLRLDVRGAFAYHPLFWVPPAAGLILLYKDKLSRGSFRCILFTIAALFVIVYLYRMISGSAIVVFEPENNIVFKAAHYILQ